MALGLWFSEHNDIQTKVKVFIFLVFISDQKALLHMFWMPLFKGTIHLRFSALLFQTLKTIFFFIISSLLMIFASPNAGL